MKDNLIKRMRDKGLRVTPQRVALIEVLVEKNLIHPSARTLYDSARRRGCGLSLSTVYLTLQELSRHGIIKTLEFDKMENRYEANPIEHVNLVCKECHAITDYKIPIVIDAGEVTQKTKFWVTDTRLEYYGYCGKCWKKRSRHPAQHI